MRSSGHVVSAEFVQFGYEGHFEFMNKFMFVLLFFLFYFMCRHLFSLFTTEVVV